MPTDVLAESGIGRYRSTIRSPVRGLWTSEISMGEFVGGMVSAIERGLTRAWAEGAQQCGIAANELSPQEITARDTFINSQFLYLTPFGRQIIDNRKGIGRLGPLMKRADLWVNAYNEAVSQSKLMACGDKKLEWRLGATDVNCRDCARYNGRVYRASTWAKYGISPQNRKLACHGFRCLCTMHPTDAPANRGRPPQMTG